MNTLEIECRINEMFSKREEARSFLRLWVDYCHQIDDMVDDGIPLIELVTTRAAQVFNHIYYRKYQTILCIVERLTHNTYFDSVRWEKSECEYLRRDAKALSHVGLDMIYAVILIEFGEDELRKWSLQIRECAVNLQKDN